MELPPRTRRRQLRIISSLGSKGTTSAYAENTAESGSGWGVGWNYLRVRGEYSTTKRFDSASGELPPRTRRILKLSFFIVVATGTTSAYAENTPSTRRGSGHYRNYLRVRGEYTSNAWAVECRTELPPRTRRIRDKNIWPGCTFGTTSAYAENTASRRQKNAYRRNYLRVRGEYPK